MTDEPEQPSLRIYRPKLTKAQADVAGQALERRQEAELQAYLLLCELLPHVSDDGSDPALTELLEEIAGVVAEGEVANQQFTEAVLGPRGDRSR